MRGLDKICKVCYARFSKDKKLTEKRKHWGLTGIMDYAMLYLVKIKSWQKKKIQILDKNLIVCYIRNVKQRNGN